MSAPSTQAVVTKSAALGAPTGGFAGLIAILVGDPSATDTAIISALGSAAPSLVALAGAAVVYLISNGGIRGVAGALWRGRQS